jgi:hypothetical protein
VERHATQLDEEIGERPAGSQREFLASTYVLGHLQTAGYVARLDPIPVGDLVRSTSVIALPPDGAAPEVVVVVAYDTPPDEPVGGTSVGFFLDLARALRVRSPRHSVEFVALGAERTSESGGHLGSRRLAQEMLDRDLDPLVMTIGDVEEAGPALASGAAAPELNVGIDPRPSLGVDVFARAGFDHIRVSGGIAPLGHALLDYLDSIDG